MKYLTKKSHLRRYMLSPEYVSGQWIQDTLKAKHATLNLQNLPITAIDGEPSGEGIGEVNTVNWTEDDIQTEAISFNCDMQLNNGVLTYKLTNTTENRILANLSISVDLFADQYACTLLYIKDEVIEKHFKDIALYTTTPQVIASTDILNSSAETLPTRAKFKSLPRKFNLVFWVNKNNPTADDIIPIVIRPRLVTESESADEQYNKESNNTTYPDTSTWANHTVTITGNLTKHEKDPVDAILYEMLPSLEVTSSSVSGDVVTVNFSTGTNISTIWLGQDVGYLPKTSVPVTNGTGSFKVVTTGLDTGEEVKVKMGHKYWSNQLTFTKTL